jgi:hypothetical protein
MSTGTCNWNQEDAQGDYWGTGCGGAFRLDADTPADDKMRFCCFCGGSLTQTLWTNEEEPNEC